MGTTTSFDTVPRQRRRIGWVVAAAAFAIVIVIGLAIGLVLAASDEDVAPADQGVNAQIATIQALATAVNSEDFDAWLATMAPTAEVPFYNLDESRSFTSAVADNPWTRTEFAFNASLDRRFLVTECRSAGERIVSCFVTDHFVLEALQFSDRIEFLFDESARIVRYSTFLGEGAHPDEAPDLLGPGELEGWRAWIADQHPQTAAILFLPDAGSDMGNGVFVRERRNDGLAPIPDNAPLIRDLVAEWFALSPAQRASYTDRFESP